jgi:guanyl-specific ribonuclease Sa
VSRRGRFPALLLVAVVVLVGLFLLVDHRGGGGGTGGPASSGSSCDLAGLPVQADRTVQEIKAGGPFPYRQDGVVFDNREGRLPQEPHGWYHEYTVVTPGSDDRGERRIIAGGQNETSPDVLYYTADHYASFCLVAGAG